LIKRQSKYVEISSDMIINQIARMVFDSFESTDFVVAILGRDGSCISSRPEVFGKVFPEQRLLDELCVKIDDGCEPLITRIDSYLVAAASLTSGFACCGASRRDNIGYAVILLPAGTSEKSIEYLDFVEIILEQFSLIAGLIERNQQLKDSCETEKGVFELPVFTSLN
jgi:hypothetical protein